MSRLAFSSHPPRTMPGMIARAIEQQPDEPADRATGRVLPVEVVRSHRRRRTLQAQFIGGTVRVLVPAGLPAEEERRLVDGLVAKVTAKVVAGHIDLATRAEVLATRYGLPRPGTSNGLAAS